MKTITQIEKKVITPVTEIHGSGLKVGQRVKYCGKEYSITGFDGSDALCVDSSGHRRYLFCWQIRNLIV